MEQEPDDLVLEMLRAIRADMAALDEKIDAKLGAFAQSMVSMRKDICNLDAQVGQLDKRIDKMDGSLQGLRGDVRMIAIAVDEHTHRLDRIEAHYNPQGTV